MSARTDLATPRVAARAIAVACAQPTTHSFPTSIAWNACEPMDAPDPTLEPETDPSVDADTGEPVDDIGEEGESAEVLALSEILPFSQYRLVLSEFDRPPSDRVQFALDQALIAACERVARILRSDLPG
jgi:hypothetical protein